MCIRDRLEVVLLSPRGRIEPVEPVDRTSPATSERGSAQGFGRALDRLVAAVADRMCNHGPANEATEREREDRQRVGSQPCGRVADDGGQPTPSGELAQVL